jgi:hypothetical protein
MYCISATCFDPTLPYHQALETVQNVTEIHNNCTIAIDISIYNVLLRYTTVSFI